MKLSDIPIRNPDIIFRQEPDGYGFVFEITTENLRTFNPTACSCWSLIDGRRNLADIVEALAEEYDASLGRIEETVTSFFSDVLEDNLIRLTKESEGKPSK